MKKQKILEVVHCTKAGRWRDMSEANHFHDHFFHSYLRSIVNFCLILYNFVIKYLKMQLVENGEYILRLTKLSTFVKGYGSMVLRILTLY